MTQDSANRLPPELRVFLHSCIESIEQVEILMILRGSGRARTARDVAGALREQPEAMRRELETLVARGLLDVEIGTEIGYRYRPRNEKLSGYCDLLAESYVSARADIWRFIATESHLSLKRFSDAFKLKDPER